MPAPLLGSRRRRRHVSLQGRLAGAGLSPEQGSFYCEPPQAARYAGAASELDPWPGRGQRDGGTDARGGTGRGRVTVTRRRRLSPAGVGRGGGRDGRAKVAGRGRGGAGAAGARGAAVGAVGEGARPPCEVTGAGAGYGCSVVPAAAAGERLAGCLESPAAFRQGALARGERDRAASGGSSLGEATVRWWPCLPSPPPRRPAPFHGSRLGSGQV